MADSLDDGEFWLPPKFLNDDDDDDMFLEDKNGRGGVGNGLFYPSEFPLASPVESLFCSSETESDEDEYIPGFTTPMPRSTLHNGFPIHNSHGWGSSGSPQSTLCGCKQKSSSRGSPNGDYHPQQLTLDLLYAAAGEVSKMRMNEHPNHFLNSGGHLPEADLGVYQQMQATQLLHLRRQQVIEQMKWGGQSKGGCGVVRNSEPQNRGRNGRNCGSGSGSGSGSSINWAPPRKQTGSGMRAVFLGAPGGKRECVGTGVFLPRQVGAVCDTRKKPSSCSTVLVPARVMQALNLNLDDMYLQQQQQRRVKPQLPPTRSHPVFNNQRIGNGSLIAEKKGNNLRVPVGNHEIRLPHEWAY